MTTLHLKKVKCSLVLNTSVGTGADPNLYERLSYFLPGLRLSSQLQSITVHGSVSNYTCEQLPSFTLKCNSRSVVIKDSSFEDKDKDLRLEDNKDSRFEDNKDKDLKFEDKVKDLRLEVNKDKDLRLEDNKDKDLKLEDNKDKDLRFEDKDKDLRLEDNKDKDLWSKDKNEDL